MSDKFHRKKQSELSVEIKEQLKNYLHRYVRFDQDELDLIYQRLELKSLKKKEYLIKEGQHCRAMYFVIDGLLRSFYIDAKGEERITQFAIENWWVTSMESFVRELPSYVSIQAVEDCRILVLHKKVLAQLYETVPRLERLFRIITEHMLISFQRKNDIYLRMSSKERYEDLVGNFPGFAQRVPQYMIASYLEITPEYLSYLRSRMRN